VQFYSKADWPAEYLTRAVTLQEPRKIGGKVVGLSDESDDAALAKLLASVFDPPPPVKPADPIKPSDPVVPPVAPVPPAPAPVTPTPALPKWVYLFLGLLAFLLVRRK